MEQKLKYLSVVLFIATFTFAFLYWQKNDENKKRLLQIELLNSELEKTSIALNEAVALTKWYELNGKENISEKVLRENLELLSKKLFAHRIENNNRQLIQRFHYSKSSYCFDIL